jgi:hypothetical protein
MLRGAFYTFYKILYLSKKRRRRDGAGTRWDVPGRATAREERKRG